MIGGGEGRKVALVLFVFLKLVKPGDAIENVIIGQNKRLKGLGVTPERLRDILETFGSRCLLILDGMDEHASNSDTESINHDVIDIIEGGKFLDCHIILTSRPHSTLKYEKEFDTIVRVDGFTRDEAEKFAMKILQGSQTLVQKVLDFNLSGLWMFIDLWICPILLSFLCVLVREEGEGLLEKSVKKGEIYARMVRCLYKKFTIRKGTPLDNDKFRYVMKSIGKIAYESLISREPLFKRSDVVREVGQDVFDLGLLIGNEDYRVVGTGDADIYITFPHRSLPEFLGAFYYVWRLSEGDSVESLGTRSDIRMSKFVPFFKDNPLFFEFCLWFSFNSEFELFVLPGRETALKSLVQYMADDIDKETLSLYSGFFPGSEKLFKHERSLMKQFYERVLEKCHKTEQLKISIDISVDWFLRCLMTEPSPKIKSLELTLESESHAGDSGHRPNFSGELPKMLWQTVERLAIDNASVTQSHNILQGIQTYKPSNLIDVNLVRRTFGGSEYVGYTCSCFESPPSPKLESVRLSEDVFLDPTRREWRFRCLEFRFRDRNTVLFGLEWPFVEELFLANSYLKTEHLTSLAKAKAEGKLPNLKSLYLGYNEHISCNLSALLSHAWPQLRSLYLCKVDLKREDLTFLARAKAEGKLPDLKVLYLDENKQISGNLFALCNTIWTDMEKLDLGKCELIHEDLKCLAQAKCDGKLPNLKGLDLRGNSVISSNLSALFNTSWPGLEQLHLSDCALKPKDLTSLANAKSEGKLANLKVLILGSYKPVSSNLSALFSTAWLDLKDLDFGFSELSPEDLTSLAQAKAEGKLPDVEALILWFSKGIPGNLQILLSHAWPGLEYLSMSDLTHQDLKKLAEARSDGILPDLRILNVVNTSQISFHFVCSQMAESTGTAAEMVWAETSRCLMRMKPAPRRSYRV